MLGMLVITTWPLKIFFLSKRAHFIFLLSSRPADQTTTSCVVFTAVKKFCRQMERGSPIGLKNRTKRFVGEEIDYCTLKIRPHPPKICISKRRHPGKNIIKNDILYLKFNECFVKITFLYLVWLLR